LQHPLLKNTKRKVVFKEKNEGPRTKLSTFRRKRKKRDCEKKKSIRMPKRQREHRGGQGPENQGRSVSMGGRSRELCKGQAWPRQESG
jgi:hypothetical protein